MANCVLLGRGVFRDADTMAIDHLAPYLRPSLQQKIRQWKNICCHGRKSGKAGEDQVFYHVDLVKIDSIGAHG